MSAFGWSYPPGCSGPPDDGPCICEVCGGNVDHDECTCPECPTCGVCGDPACYVEGTKDAGHWLVRSPEQKAQLARMEAVWAEQCIRENELATIHLES